MPTVKGNLMFVSSRAAQVSEVWVRAPQVRTHAEGLVTTGNDRFPVDGGEVSFTAVPGPAVLALISQGRAVDTIPILVGDASTQTLKQVVSAAKVTHGATRSELERLAAKAAELIDSSTENAQKAQDGATRAESAAGNAKTSETNAEDAARRASNSATSANRSSVWVSQAEQRTKKSASEAADSATQAAGSATSAKQEADRAANIANSTSWSGDKLTVNGKTSPSLRGPKGDTGDRGPTGTVAPGEIVPLPKDRIDLTSNLNTKDGSGKGALVVHGGTAFLSVEYTPNRTGTIYLFESGVIPSKYAPSEWAFSTASSTDDKDTCIATMSSRLYMSGVSSAGSLYRISMTWTIAGDVSAMSGPMGPPGEVTKKQLDTAIASEQARMVGVTWTVSKEADVATKAAAAQAGDFIQVSQTHTIYRVTSSGVVVDRYGTRTLQASTDSTSNRNPNQWLESGDPWAGVNWSRVSPPAGKWLIELINPHDFAADLYVEGSKVATSTNGVVAYPATFSVAAKSDVYVQIPGDNHYKPITLRFTPIN